MTFPELVQPLLDRKDFDGPGAERVMEFLMSGEATDSQIGAILLGLRIKGCTTRELAAFAKVMRDRAATLTHPYHDLVDTCGTGGGAPTFNISTAAAIVASAAGVRVAKHGNRSMSGMGSADVLESLGAKMNGNSENLGNMLDKLGIVFLFAPAHHPAMKHVAAARKQLGLRTVFNQLGPLANPAQAQRQLIGVYDGGLMRSMGEALRQLGTDRVLIVHGTEGIDEISPVGETEFVRVWDGKISTGTLTPSSFGLDSLSPEALAPGETLLDCAEIFKVAVSDVGSLRARAVLPNAAATIWLAGLEEDLPAATERAKVAISSGRAAEKLQQLIEFGNGE